MSSRRRANNPGRRRASLEAVKAESDRALLELIRRWQALPPEKRTRFLRKRVGFRATTL
jgi:hypothetical protein